MESNNLTQGAPPGPLFHIVIDGARYVAAGVLAAESGYCRDYITQLARRHRITGRQLGKIWYIAEEPFWMFVIEQEKERELRRSHMAASSRRLFHAHQAAQNKFT
jgi:hypothetical protein